TCALVATTPSLRTMTADPLGLGFCPPRSLMFRTRMRPTEATAFRTRARADAESTVSFLSGGFVCCARECSPRTQTAEQTKIIATRAFDARGSVGALSIGLLLVIQSDLEDRGLSLLEAVVPLRI